MDKQIKNEIEGDVHTEYFVSVSADVPGFPRSIKEEI